MSRKGYGPNVLAKGLIQNCTFNLGLAVPLEDTDASFFRACMDGICEEAAAQIPFWLNLHVFTVTYRHVRAFPLSL